MNTFLRQRLFRQFAAVLLLATLGVRALLPAGYMPGNLLDGKFAELCPVASAATFTLLAADTTHHHHGQHGNGERDDAAYSIDSACPIGSSLFADALPAADITISPVPRSRDFERATPGSVFTSKPHRYYPARAPPVS